MANASQYVMENGIISADTSQVGEDVRAEWRNALGNSFNLDPATPQGRIVEIQTAGRKFPIDLCSLVANQINPRYSTGQFLDALASIFGLERFGATNTVVYGVLTGEPNATVGAGLRDKTTAGAEFVTRQNVTIGSNGSVSGIPFYSVNTGAVPCPAGWLTKIATPTPGLETVTNPAGPVQVGTDRESDNDLRSRMISSRYIFGLSLPDAVRARLNALPDIVDYWFYNNGEGEAVTVNGDSVNAHSIALVVQGGTDTEIADALFAARSAGCGYTPISGQSVTVTVYDGTGAYKMAYNVVFNRPAAVDIDINITVGRGNYTGTDEALEEAINNALASWVAGNIDKVERPRIGGTVYTYEIGAAISEAIPEIIIKDVEIGLHGDVLSGSPITTTGAEIAAIADVNITIN